MEINWQQLIRSRRAYAKLNFKVPGDDIMQEFLSVKHLAVAHRSSYGSGWLSLTLHGHKPHWTEAINQYPGFEQELDWKFKYHWTEIAEYCPKTVEFIQSLPYSTLHRVRFMLLKPGGLIDYHRDVDKMSMSPMNVSINMPDGCEFNIYDQLSSKPIKKIPFTDNSCFLVNIGHYHRVINRSTQDRLHMIIHGAYNNEFVNNFINYIDMENTDDGQ